MSGTPRLAGNGFDVQRLKRLHKMGLTNAIICLRMGATKHVLNYWMGALKLKANREE